MLGILAVTLCSLSLVQGQTTLEAKYNMGGVTGTITFSQVTVGESVTISLDLDGVTSGSYSLELHEYRVNFDTADRCNSNSIGNMLSINLQWIGAASVTSGKGQLEATGMDLSGDKSIEGRSLVFTDGGSMKICATIEAPDTEYITAFAHLPADIGGTVIFRQQENRADADTFMYLNLFFTGETKISSPLRWQINKGVVNMDIDADTDLSDRCGSTIKELYNPDSSSGAGCSLTDHSGCKIGDLSAKHGNITINTNGNTKAFYGDLKLPLSGPNSIIGRTIAFIDGSTYFACANIVEYPNMAAVAKFSNDGVRGKIEFRQKSPLDPAIIDLDLNSLKQGGGGYHVHLWPVPQKIGETETVCDASDVGGHFDPFGAIGSNYPAPNTTTPDMYEVGDLSGKFGTLSSMNDYQTSFVDPNLQLYGKNTIIGRSIVIHKDMTGAPRWICATVWPADTVPMTTAYAKFTYPVIGYMVLRQPKDMWFAETQIYAELSYASASSITTTGHTWHIHERPMGDDLLNDTGRCQSVGGHYNPYQVFLNGDYLTQCNPDNHFRCEVGDLSGKHGKLSIQAPSSGVQKMFFSDMQLPLAGPQSVMGKSITIHGANSGGSRLSCADVREKKTRTAAVTKWTSADVSKSPTGSITFTQDCTSVLSCMTKVDVDLAGLDSLAAGYHVHKYPTDPDTPPNLVCQNDDVGGHLNPFKASYPGPTGGTMDQFEIGDLSGKFDPLTGASFSTHVVDMNLPMSGPHSIVGRSIVIHKNDATASRWACGNIVETTRGATLVEARATFTGDVRGIIHLSQYIYDNGDTSDAYIVVNLRYPNSSMTTGHNWHVHVKPVTGNCSTCGPHYNPFMVDMGPAYKTECSMYNPLRCEVGDQAGKMGQYDIGGGKRFYTDVNLNLEGKFAAAKRSIVIHGPNGVGNRIACANILPHGDSAVTYEMVFLTVKFTKYEIEDVVSSSIATHTDNVLVVGKDPLLSDCTRATVYFLGKNKEKLMQQFKDVVKSGNHDILGKFSPSSRCRTSAAGYLRVSIFTVLFCLVLSRVRRT